MKKKRETIVTVNNAKEITGVHYTLNHTGKMTGMQSLSTSVLLNPYCQKYSKSKDNVCSKCFAQRQMKMYSNMESCYAKNTEILTSKILSKKEIPLINAAVFRFESFGDLNNETQLINYFNIAKANKDTKFALWTKNPFIIESAIKDGYDKPSNLQIILSSVKLNQPVDVNRWSFIDKVFTVYDKEYLAQHPEVNINCGAKSCLKCKKCYKKSTTKYINEKVK